jgi:parallel beta-helix repeat protein
MKKTVLATIVTLLAPLVSVMFLLQTNSVSLYVEGQTQTNGIINSNTMWNKTNSPYTLTAPVTISSGATLTIEAGVEVNLNGNCLQADGILVAKGSSTEKVYLSGGSLLLNSNSIINNAVVSSTLLITVNSSSPTISYSQIDSRIIVKGGSPVISNNILSEGIHADAVGGPVTIRNNNITSRSGDRVIYVQGIRAYISGNIIVGNNNMGIQVYHILSWVSISNNKISNCSYGIYLFTGPEKNHVIENAVFNNTVGIYAYCGLTLKANTIGYNEEGLQSTHLATIEDNNFLNNSRYSLANIHIVGFNAFNNWWGTTNASLIDSMIVDKNDEPARGQVYFQPFLTEPNSGAPAIPIKSLTTPNQTSTSTPSTQSEPFPTVLVIFSVALVVVGVGLLVYFKKCKR